MTQDNHPNGLGRFDELSRAQQLLVVDIVNAIASRPELGLATEALMVVSELCEAKAKAHEAIGAQWVRQQRMKASKRRDQARAEARSGES
jgi:hypothetical protein